MNQKVQVFMLATWTLELPQGADSNQEARKLEALLQASESEFELNEFNGCPVENFETQFFVEPARMGQGSNLVPVFLGVPSNELVTVLDYAMNCGAVDYWCNKIEVATPSGKECAPWEEVQNGGVLAFHVPEEGKVYHLDQKKLAEGLRKYVALKFLTGTLTFDSFAADRIIQYALFGELRYGDGD